MSDFWQDLKYGWRVLRRSPAFAAVAVGAVGLAIGVNCGVITLIDIAVWRPLPVRDPSSLVQLHPVDGRGVRQNLFSFPEYVALSQAAGRLSDIAAYAWRPAALAAGAEPAVGSAACVSGSYFSLIGARAARGRLLAPEDDRPGAEPVIVVGQQFWRARLAADPAVVGRTVLLNGVEVFVAGVLDGDVLGTEPRSPDVWVPLALADRAGLVPGRLENPATRFLQVHGRLLPGVAPAPVEARLGAAILGAMPGPRRLTDAARVVLTPQAALLPAGPEERMLAAPGLLAVLLLLVIACANVANLLLARAVVRRREIAVRLSVGASRARIVRQLLTESLLIAALGATLGMLLATWGLGAAARSVIALLPPEAGHVVLRLSPSARVAAYVAGLVLLSVLAFGLAPALSATSPDLMSQIKARADRSTLRGGLVAAQVMGCVVLVVAAGILVRSARHLVTVSTGLETSRVLVAQLGVAAQSTSRARFAAGVAVAPGVAAIARVEDPPFSGPSRTVLAEPDGGKRQGIRAVRVSAQYFAVVGQRLIEGRVFTEAESANHTRLAVISESAARRLWPNQQAMGRSVTLPAGDAAAGADTAYEVVGVVANERSGVLWDPDDAYLYLPVPLHGPDAAGFPLLLRTDADPALVTASLRALAADADPAAPLVSRPLSDLLQDQLIPFRYAARFALGVGALGMLLAAVGLYGVVSYVVRQRTREIAVRIALGAGAGDVLRLVLGRELRLVLLGLAMGLVLATGEAKLLSSVVVPLVPLGLAGFVLVPAFLLGVAALAVLGPARRALRVEPVRALQEE